MKVLQNGECLQLQQSDLLWCRAFVDMDGSTTEEWPWVDFKWRASQSKIDKEMTSKSNTKPYFTSEEFSCMFYPFFAKRFHLENKL